ncbi:aminopeptidase II. Metallo peptidase. MEROPS family M29 [Alteribacillus persepolensis]|uniref:Aminopeptidase II. Metallo peptidase. MEROPS family M29 n=1 Tax=Alteribacillus persepolensis TaxID=568899 RepID=A0A1G8DBE9_9BACI|nr:aminopeptidase [Alteribacillus persepolensis]SDH55012.1 aminopeptidase II. Metallo peptidase. MEROPS family M29 [Alteribacillus persepolensis]
MNTFEQHLDNYAELAVKQGVNLQNNQTLFISAPITSASFVHLLAEKAYDNGAKNVHVDWVDEALTRMKYEKAPDEAFHEFPSWVAQGREQLAQEGAAFITVKSTDPDLLKGIDQNRIAAANKAAGEAMEMFREYIQSDTVSWLVIAAPSPGWAQKVFPDASEKEAEQKLWEAIFQAVRADQKDPVQNWEEHKQKLQEKADLLNNKQFTQLHYTAPGTDLTIELAEGHIWTGGGSKNQDGVSFIPNMPTEEVFTAPHKTGVNGYVTNTKPLNYSGNIIDDFTLHFKNGKIVDYQVKQGKETLKHLIETDDGSHYLGEVALVPHSSPISQTGTLFYNTLFDENASNHLAIGSAYAFCVQNGTDMSKEEKEAHGINTSITHVDFMVGSADMNIDGQHKDGSTEPIMRNGEWAI